MELQISTPLLIVFAGILFQQHLQQAAVYGSDHGEETNVCLRLNPELLLANGVRKSTIMDMCGDNLTMNYPQQMHHVYISLRTLTNNIMGYCNLVLSDKKMKEKKGVFTNSSCPMEFEVSDNQHILKITSSVPTCMNKVTVKHCLPGFEVEQKDHGDDQLLMPTIKRSLSAAHRTKRLTLSGSHDSDILQPVVIGIFTVGFVIVILSTILLTLSCCHKAKDNVYSKDNSRTKLQPEVEDDENGSVNNNHASASPVANKTGSFERSWVPSPSSPTIEAKVQHSPQTSEYGYARPSSLNYIITSELEQEKQQHSRSGPKTQQLEAKHTNTDKEHLYSVLDTSHVHTTASSYSHNLSGAATNAITTATTGFDVDKERVAIRRPTGEHAYFVLDVTLDGPSIQGEDKDHSEGMPVDEDPSPITLPIAGEADRIYHVLEPLSCEDERRCTVCNRLIQDEPDSVYLVILPDNPSQSHEDVTTPQFEGAAPLSVGATSPLEGVTPQSVGESSLVQIGDVSEILHSTGKEHQSTSSSSPLQASSHEPLYQVLEQPSVICQSCLYANENDPIYNEVEKLPDPIYERIKMFRQDTSLSDNSHLYMSLEIPEVETPLSPRKRYLKEIRMASTISGDYASIPGSPMGTPVRRISIDQKEQPQQGHLSQFLSSLKRKLIHQLKNNPHQDAVSDKMVSEEKEVHNSDDHHDNESIVDPADTLTQVQLEEMQKRKRSYTVPTKDLPSPTKSLVRSKSHNYTPLIVSTLQTRNGGSYHKLNVDDVWEMQQKNRYAPVSVIVKQESKARVRGNKRVNSLRSRRSVIQEKLKNDNASGYEVPVNLRPYLAADNLVIPPPQVVKTSHLSRQKAIYDHPADGPTTPQSPIKKISILSTSLSTSEPCLSSSSNDYDCLEKLPSPTNKTPTSTVGPHSLSFTKAFLERASTAPILKPILLYGRNDSNDYDSLQSPEETMV